jgi:hypothetical protein
VAGEIAPLYTGRSIGAMRKKPKRAQKKGNGLSPSVTLTHYPLNAYINDEVQLDVFVAVAQAKASHREI